MTKTQRKAINKMVKGKSCLRYSGGSEKRNNAIVKCIQLQLRNDCLWEVSRLFVCRRMNLSFPTNKWISGIWMHEIPIGIACNNYKIGLLIKTTLALFKKLLKSCLSFGGKSNEHLTICVVSMLLAAQKNEWKTAEQTETLAWKRIAGVNITIHLIHAVTHRIKRERAHPNEKKRNRWEHET